MLIPEDMQWDSFDEDEYQPRKIYISPEDQIKTWFEQGGNDGCILRWARLTNPAVDAYAVMQEILGDIVDQGQEIDEWPEDYDSAPLLRRARRLQHKQQ